jgi:hypothetical protein
MPDPIYRERLMTRKVSAVEAKRQARFMVLTGMLVVCVGFALVHTRAVAQTMRNRGLAVSPAYEGWRQNADGTLDIIFGYMNSNWEEEFDVPIGPDNHFESEPADRGQPTHFFPRRNRYVFYVHVPKDFGNRELVWTLKTNGESRHAFGSLKPDYLLNDVAMMSDDGSLGGSTVTTPEVRSNTPPSLEAVGDRIRTARVGVPLVLAAHATDDGLPPSVERGFSSAGSRSAEDVGITDLRMVPPYQITQASAAGGVWVSLVPYRGPGGVKIEPDQIDTWEDTRPSANSPWSPRWAAPPPPKDGRWEATVTFSQPGEYVLRWHASDGGLFTDQDVKITVTR